MHHALILINGLQLASQAKKAAEEASKSVQEASKSALEASKSAAGVSKNTLEDLTYVGKSTLGDLTKGAKEVVTKKGLLRVNVWFMRINDIYLTRIFLERFYKSK